MWVTQWFPLQGLEERNARQLTPDELTRSQTVLCASQSEHPGGSVLPGTPPGCPQGPCDHLERDSAFSLLRSFPV